jgi:PAS domain S-box-containing protein
MGETPSTILIVDDNVSVHETLAALLADQNYYLVFAASGSEGLRAAAALKPDAILLDVMMPDMDGFEVCQRLRNDPELAQIPVIMITVLDDRASRLQGLAAGADEFLAKPFDRIELLIRLATITRLSRYRLLLEERTQLAQMVDLAPEGMLAADGAGTIHLANPALRHMLGLNGDAPSAVGFFGLIATDHHAIWEACLKELTVGAVPQRQFESVLLHATGRRVPVEVTAGRFAWQNQPAVLFMIRDITERRRAELLEVEQRQIAAELHDGLAQIVAATHQSAQLFALRYDPRTPAARHDLERLCALAQESVAEARRLLAGMRPTALDDFGLATALRMQVLALQAEGWQISYDEGLDGVALSPALETALFRIAQEALSNTRKHAGTTTVSLTLRRNDAGIELVVQDWGRGFDLAALSHPQPGNQLGLRTMQDRVALVGGTLSIHSHPGSGTVLDVVVPFVSPDPGFPARSEPVSHGHGDLAGA